jgi:hypothetical protein
MKVVNFIDDAWHSNHITIGLFEVQNISNAYMEIQMKGYWGLLDYWTRLLHMSMLAKVIINLASLATIIALIVSCFSLKSVSPFVGSCFKHAMSKATQYAIDDSKVCQGMTKVSFKQSQSGTPKDHNMNNESCKRVARMERCLHSYKSSSPDIENAHENMVCFTCNILPKNVSIPRCNFNLLW